MFKQPLSLDTKVVISNALYFNGSWEYEFLFEPPDFVGIPAEFNSFNRQIPLTLMEARQETLNISYIFSILSGNL